MTTLREAAQQALEALENCNSGHGHRCSRCDMKIDGDGRVVAALKAALAEPVQEPVAWKDKTYGNLHHQDFGNSIPLYTAPPQRKPLTEEEIDAIPCTDGPGSDWDALVRFARAIEKAHGIGVRNE